MERTGVGTSKRRKPAAALAFFYLGPFPSTCRELFFVFWKTVRQPPPLIPLPKSGWSPCTPLCPISTFLHLALCLKGQPPRTAGFHLCSVSGRHQQEIEKWEERATRVFISVTPYMPGHKLLAAAFPCVEPPLLQL